MFGKTGFLRRVNAGVDAVLDTGETRIAAAYLQGRQPGVLEAIFATATAEPFILAVTESRFLLLAMGVTANRSRLLAAVPRAQVRALELTNRGVTRKLRLALPDGQEATFTVMTAWKAETLALAQALGMSQSAE